MRKPLEDWTGS